jgi:hypothetical protein
MILHTDWSYIFQFEGEESRTSGLGTWTFRKFSEILKFGLYKNFL